MKESIGASWLLTIVLVFIALFSGYLAFSVNYSKAFRVKDGIVDRLEKYNGPNNKSLEEIAEFIGEVNYTSKGKCDSISGDDRLPSMGVVVGDLHPDIPASENDTYHYCIQRIKAYSPNDGQLTSSYYRVVVFFSLSLPIFNIGSTFHVDGETINIQYPEDDYME